MLHIACCLSHVSSTPLVAGSHNKKSSITTIVGEETRSRGGSGSSVAALASAFGNAAVSAPVSPRSGAGGGFSGENSVYHSMHIC